MTDESVPDLYRLAFIPGQFRCPQCSFQWSIQTINLERGEIGTTEENRQAPDCLNDGTRMVHVTYQELLECYAGRLKEELDRVDLLRKGFAEAYDLIESAFSHVSHGGPTRREAEEWLKANAGIREKEKPRL
jgi:hypothetical protein